MSKDIVACSRLFNIDDIVDPINAHSNLGSGYITSDEKSEFTIFKIISDVCPLDSDTSDIVDPIGAESNLGRSWRSV